jgi:hypothetical protein
MLLLSGCRREFEEAIKSQERAFLEKLRRRQQKELQQLMLYEIRVSAMQERKRREQMEAEERERQLRARCVKRESLTGRWCHFFPGDYLASLRVSDGVGRLDD